MKLAFTTLACPSWDLPTIISQAKQNRLHIDFRGLGQTLDVTTLPQFTRDAATTRRMIEDAGLEVAGLSTSINICDETKRHQYLEEARRSIHVALNLGCPNIRVFGGGNVKEHGKEKAAQFGRECLREILRLDSAAFLNWNVETHDSWTKGADVAFLLEGIDHPSVGVLWDLGHPPRFDKEMPAETYAAIGDRVRYTHVKDSAYDPKHPKAMQDGWRYVPPGEGTLPIADAVKLLKQGGYSGYLTLEHEKRWHPELEEADVILPKFAAWARTLI